MNSIAMTLVMCGALAGNVGQAHVNVRVGTPVVTAGRITPDAIKQVVTQNLDPIRKCYADGLKKNPRLFGIVQVAMNINGTTGAVSSARQGSATTMADPDVDPCVTHAFLAFKFPPSDDGHIVLASIPLTFSAS